MSLTRALVGAVRGIRFAEVPEDAREAARHCLLDFLGCAIAGSRQPLVEILLRSIVRSEGSNEASLVARTERASRLTAALVNGAAGHALDFDDTHMAMNGHPSVPVLPALLALAESEGASGAGLLTALVAGIELECRLGLLLGVRHYDVGFHTTGTVGTFGAAAACAHLLGLDENGWIRAIGLAGTEAAGLKSAFGTMAKPLHAGRAAAAGLLAALLARDGFTAATDVLEAKQGFFDTHHGAAADAKRLDGWAGRFFVRETLFKYHAACYLTHAPIEAARRLRQGGLDPESIDLVTLTVSPMLLGVCSIPEPKTGLEGKFSLRATTALALLGEDTASLATYSDAKMAEARLVRLRDRVLVETDPELAPTEARVRIAASGKRLEEVADSGTPARELAAQRTRLREKFTSLVPPVIGPAAAEAVAGAALDVDRRETTRELVAGGRP